VSFPLADCATEIHAAHLLGLNAATLLDGGHRAIDVADGTNEILARTVFQRMLRGDPDL
jgi:alkylation response protein AidB-like acyl-CoA dehydrogenase